MARTGSARLLVILSVIGSVFSGFIDPQIIQLLKAADSSSYYVVSPFHLVPASFAQYGLFGQTAAVAASPVTNQAGSVKFTEDTVQVERRVLNPPKSGTEATSSGNSATPDTKFADSSSASNDEYLPPKDEYLPPKTEEAKSPEYLPPKNDYLPPKKEEDKSPEYLPPKPVYGPPSTEAPAVIHTAPLIFKSYIEPGFSFGEYPLNLVPYKEVAAAPAEPAKEEPKGGY